MKPKDFVAKALYRAVKAARYLVGKRDQCIVTRRGFRFELDLSQGIDFAIYLMGAWELDTVAAVARCVKPGQAVLDIGANVGAITLELARAVGPPAASLRSSRCCSRTATSCATSSSIRTCRRVSGRRARS